MGSGKENNDMKKSMAKHILSLLLFGMNGIIAARISLTSYEIVLFRTMIGSLFLGAVVLLARQKIQMAGKKKDVCCLLISGIAMGASWMFLYESYKQMGVSIATLIYYTGPVIVMVFSTILFQERITWNRAAAIVAVLAGIVLMNGGDLKGGVSRFGVFCGIMSAVTYAVMVIANKKAKGMDGLSNAMFQLFFAFLAVADFVIARKGLNIRIAGGDWIWILLLGLVNTGGGCYLYFSSIGGLPVQTVAVLGYLEPLSAVAFSALLLGERLQGLQVAGAAFILFGAVLGQQFLHKEIK